MRSAPHVDRQELAAIFAGGFLGTIARAALAQSLAVRSDRWPWATFAVNILAALALGYVITQHQQRRSEGRAPHAFLGCAFLGTVLCGALSTFSTMMVELLRMIDGAHWALALGYTAASVACGLTAVLLTSRLARRTGTGV
jgi:fluoride exporter